MNFIQLEYFRKVVECGSVTQASKDLFITQPAVSKQIRLLEEELGCELFIRRGNHLALTREGGFLYEHAKNIVTRINDLPSEMSSFLHRVSGKLTIGCGPHTSRTIMPDLIADLIRKYPAIQPVMFEKDWSESTEDLLTGKLDIVVGVTPHRSEKIAFTRLFKSRMVLIYSRKSPLAKEKKITPELLEKQPYITYTDESILRNCLRALPYPVRSPLFLQTRYSETIITYVQKNMGYGIIPEYVLDNFSKEDIVTGDFHTGIEIDIGFQLDASRSVPPPARALIELMKTRYHVKES